MLKSLKSFWRSVAGNRTVDEVDSAVDEGISPNSDSPFLDVGVSSPELRAESDSRPPTNIRNVVGIKSTRKMSFMSN